jgi:hypothetical protein
MESLALDIVVSLHVGFPYFPLEISTGFILTTQQYRPLPLTSIHHSAPL